MAKIVPILGNLSGSIAGNTFSHNRGGSYVRNRGIPTNPNSSRQQRTRTRMTTCSGLWRGLTSNQRAAWAVYATLHPRTGPLGESVLLSGQQWFNSVTGILQDLGLAYRGDPPELPAPAPITTLSVIADQSGVNISLFYAPTPLPANTYLLAWHTLPGSAGRDPNFAQARLAGASAVEQATGWIIGTWCGLVIGQVLTVYAQTANNQGLTGPPLKARATVVA